MRQFVFPLAAAAAVSIVLAACGSSSPPPAQPAPGQPAAWGPPGSPTSPPPAGPQNGEEYGEEYGDERDPDWADQAGPAYPAPDEEPTPRRGQAGRPEPRPDPAPERGDDSPRADEAPARADSMSELERAIAEEINRMRRNPKAWVSALQRYRGYYDGRFLRVPGGEIPIQTFEGVAAVDEAIAAARASKPLPEMRVSPGLGRAAREHAKEIGAAGTIDHYGKNGSTPFDRMKRQGRLDGMAGENIGTALHGAGELVVIDLFVDDGVQGRGHRKNLLSPRYHVVGVGCAPHKAYGTICVLDFAEAFEER
jgi:GNAT superfamily N-acetyltransferase